MEKANLKIFVNKMMQLFCETIIMKVFCGWKYHYENESW